MLDNRLNDTIRTFDAVEANLLKAEKLLSKVNHAIPVGICFGSDPGYERDCVELDALIAALPPIDDWRPEIILVGLNAIAQNRLDAKELGDIESIVSVEETILEPSRQLGEYRYRFDKARRQLVRGPLVKLIDAIDAEVCNIGEWLKAFEQSGETCVGTKFSSEDFNSLKEHVTQIAMLLGSKFTPPRWAELKRHIAFGQLGDLHDIIQHDWPSVRAGLHKSLYGENDPIPVPVTDLAVLANAKPTGQVATRLKWSCLTEEEFERLIFTLLASTEGYENPQWLMKTNAPDKGRDLSVDRVLTDSLTGTIRQRAIIQCKHWLSKSVSLSEVAILKEQMAFWDKPRVGVCIIATSGRFTSDAVSLIELHNQSGHSLRIEMWPESHLELLLASRPDIIAEFGLR